MSLCIVTIRMVAPCDNCARPATPVHMPRQQHGLYCADCCPACSGGKSSDKSQEGEGPFLIQKRNSG